MLFLILSAVFGATAVMAGAAGAHLLASLLDEKNTHYFELAYNFQLLHAIMLAVIGILSVQLIHNIWISLAGWLMVAGIVLFSGSLYLLAITHKELFSHIAPFGGSTLIISWAMLAVAVITNKQST